MKRVILIAIILNFAAFAGDGVGNGGGIAENNFVFAHNTLSEYIKYALNDVEIKLEKNEQEVLKQISNVLDREKSLIFLSGRNYPQIFIYPFPEVRIAVTGSKVGDTIYINTDLLYWRVSSEIKYITISQAISILIHELGHHHAIKDELFLNTLGSKVASAVFNKFETRKLRDDNNIFLKFINLGQRKSSQILISDSVNSFNLSKDLMEKVRCENETRPIGIEIWQSQWSRFNRSNWYLNNQLIIYCETNEGLKVFGNLEYIIIPSFERAVDMNLIKEVKTYVNKCDLQSSSCLAKQQELFNLKKNLREEK